ncbi:hypothetical protein ACFYT4_15150 [Streptomyces sp. NPDC004609]|uniref:hypothetical protein n=1 Tax=Streptomyces sp. NPDC004609 TaxID=3364704 RepID=UPI00369B7483
MRQAGAVTTADAVRRRLGLGRLLPLGDPGAGAWLTEQSAETVLRHAADGLPGVEPGRLRLALADPESVAAPAVPPPPSALPPGPLRIDADFAAVGPRPLPELASALRETLFTAAADRLGLVVTEVDLRVTELLDAPAGVPGAPPQAAGTAGAGGTAGASGSTAGGTAGEADRARPDTAGPAAARPAETADPVAVAAAGAPGVAGLTAVLGAPVHRAADHVRVEVAVAHGHRPPEVVRAVREAVSAALADGRPVSVLVTAVEI